MNIDWQQYASQYRIFLNRLQQIQRFAHPALAYPLAARIAHHYSPNKEMQANICQSFAQAANKPEIPLKKFWSHYLNHVGATDLNTFMYRKMTPQWIKQRVKINSPVTLESLRKHDRGLFVMTYHNHYPHFLGVVLGQMGLEAGLKSHLIAMDITASPLYDYLREEAEAYYRDCENCFAGGQYLYMHQNQPIAAMRKLHQALRNGETVISLNDFPSPFISKRNLELSVFGYQYAFPVGTLEIALRQKTPVVAAWIRWLGWDRFCLEVRPLATENGLENVMAQYLEILQSQLVVADPALWEGWKWLTPEMKVSL
ncbi:hypothetical protein QUF61_06110 [Candidatus Venteria ishoeyi]|uniref:hypothetical protein n=1 Tax=Candidatus Venteria ishoeyi TaxID=1899563 RepID=UPI0025A4D2A6|nr:hypothetical protein [Candidatus Venteria ishoeyi]MDM8546049.1 hypothetical protein [Candidatus Venteria ishoeyi]